MSEAPIEVDDDVDPIGLGVELDDGVIALSVGEMLIALEPALAVRLGLELCAAGFAANAPLARQLH